MSDGIVFQIDTSRILKLIASEIYDSPLAMLRENVQNAYDAIRMRFADGGVLSAGGQIDVEVSDRFVTIVDNGIGMSESVLRENFWKAGSSGKRSADARRAGVVGTFGIGAMANFGVATDLQVETRELGSPVALLSRARRDELVVSAECISLERMENGIAEGTKVTIELDEACQINVGQAIAYLKPYVAALDVPVHLNGRLISQQSEIVRLSIESRNFKSLGHRPENDDQVSASFEVFADGAGQVLVRLSDIALQGEPLIGGIVLVQSGGTLMGQRSGFGLAPIPVTGAFEFGGYVDLPVLSPTAGREAISRESIALVGRFVRLAEQASAELLASTEYADQNGAFLTWAAAGRRADLARNVRIVVFPSGESIPLKDVPRNPSNSLYYTGTDAELISMFSSGDNVLYQVAQASARRQIQLRTLLTNGIHSVPDSATVLHEFSPRDLSTSEASILVQIGAILREDYLVVDAEIVFAKISHSVVVFPQKNGEFLRLFLARDASVFAPLRQVFEEHYAMYVQFMKDFVRAHLYPRIREFVPSSTREGVEALRSILERNRELYRYEQIDFGEAGGLLGDFIAGTSTLSEVVSRVRASANLQSQSVSPHQVGAVETVIPEPVNFEVSTTTDIDALLALPAIVRDEVSTDLKVLVSGALTGFFGGYQLLLGLSDRLMRTEAAFFRVPHSTRVLWGGHRVIYIFTDASNEISLYYDIELKNPISVMSAGGTGLRTTSLITANRIFVPIPDPLVEQFRVTSGAREFFVRFDILASNRL